MTHVKSILTELSRRLAALHREETKLKDAIRTISSLNGSEPAPGQEKRFARRVRFKQTCTRCGKLFTAKRNGKAYGRGNAFCHKPCTSSAYLREQKAALANRRPQPTVLLKGDALSASH